MDEDQHVGQHGFAEPMIKSPLGIIEQSIWYSDDHGHDVSGGLQKQAATIDWVRIK